MYSDLTGERGTLMGCLAGILEAQYNLLRKKGHTPSEAFNETVEELTQSLIALVAENGMDWMFSNCSTTAQRGRSIGKIGSATPSLPCSTNSTRALRRATRRKLRSLPIASPIIKKNYRPNWTPSRIPRCGWPVLR